MQRWLLIPITTLLVYSIAHVEVFFREVAFTLDLRQLLSTNEPAVASREMAPQGRSKDKAEDKGKLASIKPTIPLYSVPRGQAAKALLSEANRELKLVKISSYSHKTHVNEAVGQFEYDCSGFLKYALSRSVPEALHSLQTATVRRPLAKHFVGFVTSLPSGKVVGRWKRIDRVTDLAPGDIIAWIKPPTVVSDNTGHVMIVRAAIRRHPKRSNEIIIPIIDSTATRHGRSDSRHKAAETGLGTGSIILVVDDSGQAIGYRWSRSQNSRRYTTKVVLARLE
jgi:hypothetical protein